MERDCREKQTPIEFRRRKICSDTEKNSDVSPAAIKNIGIGADDDSMKSIESPTPEKSDQKLSSREKQLHDNSSSRDILSEAFVPEIALKSTELPEKLKSLAELFDRMISSVRLLGLRKRLSTFQNICTQVEIMTRRKFSYGHLAQMKYAFPDAIQLEKVLIHDERTLCMIPDLKVIIIFDIMGRPYPGQSVSMALCDAFRVRLFEHLNANQDAEIPEAALPEPFNQKNIIKTLDSLSEESPSELPQQASVGVDSIINVSHFSSSFRKKFCEKIIVPEADLTKVLASASLPAISDNLEVRIHKNFDTSLPDVKYFSKSIYIPSLDQFVERTPVKCISTAYDDQISGDITAETPVMKTPKRPVPSPVEILVSTNEKAVSEPKSTPSVRRTLIYSPHKLDSSISKLDFDTEECTGVHEQVSDGTISSKRNICAREESITRDVAGSKESQKSSQSNFEKRGALLNCLPAMFDTIHFICQSVDCSLITKQELVHKIISNNLDIEETSQVEEQLGLLEEMVPDWMSKKTACNGEVLYCIKRVSDPNAVRIRLSEAQ
ncbi:hypothetical protein KSP39_PZI000976 [Platanthera zijinensis]|uniref:CDT1 Geminin-binding domain-containing protein n=1 Tax=Platanthera zijinensis TaxID=2320716 RepID=A0AAP0C2X3_9ASPA